MYATLRVVARVAIASLTLHFDDTLFCVALEEGAYEISVEFTDSNAYGKRILICWTGTLRKEKSHKWVEAGVYCATECVSFVCIHVWRAEACV